jgi:hypothetical protein
MADTHVVTFRMQYDTGAWCICEFWRGELSECRNIARRFGGVGSDELKRVTATDVVVSTLDEWNEFVKAH